MKMNTRLLVLIFCTSSVVRCRSIEIKTSTEQQTSIPGGQHNATALGQRNATTATQQNATPGQQNTTPVRQQNTTPAGQQNAAPEGQQNTAPATQQNAAPAAQQNATQTTQQNVTQATQHKVTPATQKNATPATQQNATPATQQNATPATQQDATPATQQNVTLEGQQNATPMWQQNAQNGKTPPADLYLEAYPADPPEYTIDAPPFQQLSSVSPFQRVEEIFSDFESQVAALHAELCRTSCNFPYPISKLSEARACSKCFCDNLCYVYNDCCPDKQLLNHTFLDEPEFPFSLKEMKDLSRERSIYSCEITHLKPQHYEGDYNNYFSMINYCPRIKFPENASATSDVQTDSSVKGTLNKYSALSDGEGPQSLESMCENRKNSSHWHYIRPLSSRSGLVYRNKFCAECHGEHRDNLTDWTTNVECDAELLYTATSPSDAYFMAVNTPDCDIRFHSNSYEVLRQCSSVIHPVISSCNQTGFWEFYDEKIERACASFTAVVMKTYKNVFCYMCNHNLNFATVQHDLEQGSSSANIARVSFFALLDLDGDSTETEGVMYGENRTASVEGEREECGDGTIRDPLQCHCRAVECGAGLHQKGDNCTAVFESSNFFGYSVCSRFQITDEEPVSEFTSMSILLSLTFIRGDLSVQQATAVPRLGCDDNKTLTVDIQANVYSFQPKRLDEIAASFLQFVQNLAHDWSYSRPANMTVVTPASACISDSDWPEIIPESCSTKNTSVAMGVSRVAGLSVLGVQDQIAYSELYNTTFCSRVNLTEEEFTNYSSWLRQVGLSEERITHDIISENGATFYLLCVRDYLQVRSPGACGMNPSGPDTVPLVLFEDTWTTLGLISTVSTCISLACLLCVIVSYTALSPLRAGSGRSTLAMACLLFLAQALHEVGLEQFEIPHLCLVLAVLIHFFWLSAVFMMTSCTLQLFFSMTRPLQARTAVSSRKVLTISLASSLALSAAIIGMTMLCNYLVHGDLGYPAKYLCFIRRSLSRQLGFGLPLGLAVSVNALLFILTVKHIRRRPHVNSTRQPDHVSLLACFRLSVITGSCWLSLFLLAVPGTRPWLEYAFVVLLGLQGLLLATTLLLNARVLSLWKVFFNQRGKKKGGSHHRHLYSTSSSGIRTDSERMSTNVSTTMEQCSSSSPDKSNPGAKELSILEQNKDISDGKKETAAF